MEDFSQKMLEDSSKLKTRCAGLNTEINRLLEAHKALPPDKKRNEYNRMMNTIDNKMNESNREILLFLLLSSIGSRGIDTAT